MQDGLDWLLRPVARGMCQYESLVNNALDLCDIMIMNDCLDVLDENERRLISFHKNR